MTARLNKDLTVTVQKENIGDPKLKELPESEPTEPTSRIIAQGLD